MTKTRTNSVSAVMPFWRRPRALHATLIAYRALYAPQLERQELEIVVVDDGSGDLPTDMDGARVVSLPKKGIALNPCVPFNRGVEESTGEFVCLTNPEVTHAAPILFEMREECRRLGPKAYVAAACWDDEDRRWFCHSYLEPDPRKIWRWPVPKGAGLHFCAMLRREFYDEVGGFDEAYREGQAFDDNDLLWKLYSAGAVFKIRDDLVTHHQTQLTGPRCKWAAGGWTRNKDIFEKKWSHLLSQPNAAR